MTFQIYIVYYVIIWKMTKKCGLYDEWGTTLSFDATCFLTLSKRNRTSFLMSKENRLCMSIWLICQLIIIISILVKYCFTRFTSFHSSSPHSSSNVTMQSLKDSFALQARRKFSNVKRLILLFSFNLFEILNLMTSLFLKLLFKDVAKFINY